MKTLVTALVVSVAVVGLSAHQNPPPPVQQQQQQQATPPQQPQQQKMPDVVLTGCLVQGSTPSVFLFQNVRRDPKSTTEPAVKYVVVASTEDLNLRTHLNHEVQITGLSEVGKVAPPTTQKVEEKDLPRFSAKAVTMVADTCGSSRAR